MSSPQDGACILILRLPPSSLCGIDLLSFTPSPRFHGIKQVPSGWHFLFTGSTSSLSIRYGEWLYVSPEASDAKSPTQSGSGPRGPQLHIRRWDPSTESLRADESLESVQQWRSRLSGIWNEGLTPYRQTAPSGNEAQNDSSAIEEGTQDWRQLTDCITPSLMSRITGSENDRPDWCLTSASAATRDMDDIPGLSNAESTTRQLEEKELKFLPIDLKQTWRTGAVGRERTEAAQDRSWALGDVLGTEELEGGQEDAESALLGEMQLCFLMVLTLANYSCLEQWKRMLGLLLTCRSAVLERPGLFSRALRLLLLQLRHCGDVEGGLFDMSDEGGSLLESLLKGFRRTLEDVWEEAKRTSPETAKGVDEVRDHFEDVQIYMKAEFGWELSDSYVRRGLLELEDGEQVEMEVNDLEGEDERGEYAPVIVDLDGIEDQEQTTP